MTVDLDDIRAALDRPPLRASDADASRAAVAAILTDDLELVFMRRAHDERDPWSGHVSFPGGRMDEGDRSLLHTAIRETREELGLRLPAHTVLGQLDEIRTLGHLPPLVIRPYVFHMRSVPPLEPNHEVASVHRFPIEALLSGVGRGEFQRVFFGEPRTFPHVDFDGVRLWGLTLMMVDDLLDRLDGQGRGLARRGAS